MDIKLSSELQLEGRSPDKFTIIFYGDIPPWIQRWLEEYMILLLCVVQTIKEL